MASDEELETQHFNNVLLAFQQYRSYSLSANERRLKDYHSLPPAHQKLLNELGWRQKIDAVDDKIEANARFLNEIVDYPQIFDSEEDDHAHSEASHSHSHGSHEAGGGGHSHGEHSHTRLLHGAHDHSEDEDGGEETEGEPHPYDALQHAHTHDGHTFHTSHDHNLNASVPRRKQRVSDADMDKLRSTLKQFVRDWSVEGRAERDACYTPMLEALENHFSSVPHDQRKDLNVLVPGAGLARLAFEVIQRGFSCQGNEFSHFMLLSSYFILNRSSQVNQHTIYPYIHSFSNIRTNEALLQGVTIPDVLPSDLPRGPNFSLVAGDFEEIYGPLSEDDPREPQQGKWDAVLTCFFIDTAKNIVNYLSIIHELLTPGGVWINLGPLLWHFENSPTNDPSIELSLSEVRALAEKIGFEFIEERTIDTTYTERGPAAERDGGENSGSMLGYVYHSAFWVARKKIA